MISLQFLQILWFVLILVLLAGFALLDGFDLGIGIILPFFAKNDEEKKVMLDSIAPFWDGNEVWLVTAGGALFGSFPDAYATALSGFYIVFILTLFSLIFRAVSFEFRAHDEKRRKFWDTAFSAGSFFAILFFGIMLGNVIYGVPLDAQKEFSGTMPLFLRPFPMIIAFLGFCAVIMQALSYVALKTSGDLRQRAFIAVNKLWPIFSAAFIIFFLSVFIFMHAAANNIFIWIGLAIFAAATAGIKVFIKNNRESMLFLMSSLALIGIWIIIGAIHFPNLIKAINGNDLSITVYNSSSPLSTLKLMSIVAVVGMPIVIAYTVFVYRVFKGKTGKAGY